MNTSTVASNELTDLVEQYADAEFAQASWFTRLHLEQPRKSVRCLAERTRLTKRLIDIGFSVTLLVLASPLMLLVAVLIRCTSPGPIIFRQKRVGLNLRVPPPDRRNPNRPAYPADDVEQRRADRSDRRFSPGYGQPFMMYKFRTMRTDAERNGAQFAVKGDPRVTPLGKFLRKTRIDELPQLWNVLRGDMTLVGPRPERPEFIEQLSAEIPDYIQRLGLRPGLTGLAQIINGYDNDIESFRRKVALDLLYLQNCCVWNDIKILIRTVGVVLTGKGAL